ncbi:MAG: MFS transporter [Acidimicrobiia bacterium]
MRREGLGPDFAKLWGAAAVSNLGDGVRLAALPLLASALTRDPGLVAGLTVALRLPWLLLSLPAGAIIDRLDRRRLMARASLLQGAAMASLGAALWAGWAGLPMLYLVAFLLGTGEVVRDTASHTVVPSLVPMELLERANGRLYATQMVANELVGPPIGSSWRRPPSPSCWTPGRSWSGQP